MLHSKVDTGSLAKHIPASKLGQDSVSCVLCALPPWLTAWQLQPSLLQARAASHVPLISCRGCSVAGGPAG